MSYTNDYMEIFSKTHELKILMSNFSIEHNKSLTLTISTVKERKSLKLLEYEEDYLMMMTMMELTNE